MLSPAQRRQFLQFPQLNLSTLWEHYTLSAEELQWVQEKQGSHNRLGFAVHLKVLQHIVRNPETLEIPSEVIHHVANQLRVNPGLYQDYLQGKLVTLKQHKLEIRKKLGLKTMVPLELFGAFSTFLRPFAFQHCDAFPLMTLLVDEMRARKVLWGKFHPLEVVVDGALKWATEHTQDLLLAHLRAKDKRALDHVLKKASHFEETDHGLLGWFRESHVDANPKSITSLLDKLRFLEPQPIPWAALKLIPRSRLERMTLEARTLQGYQFRDFEPRRRYTTVLVALMDLTYRITDQIFDLHQRIMLTQLRNCQHRHIEDLKETHLGLADALLLHQKVGEVLIRARETGKSPFEDIDKVVSWETYVESVRGVAEITRETEFDSLRLMEGRLEHFRQYSHHMLGYFKFQAGTADQEFLQAMQTVQALREDPELPLPEDTPTGFVSGRWTKFVLQDGKINRAFYELCLLDTLTRKLHAGDVHLERSRKFRDFEDYLLARESWKDHLKRHPLLVSKDFSVFWENQMEQLGSKLTEVDLKLHQGELPDVRMEAGKVVVSRNRRDINLSGKAKKLGKRLYGLIPTVKITDIMLEVDRWIRYHSHFTHYSQGKTVDDPHQLYGVLLAEGTNLGLRKMAHATNPVNFKRLSWIRECYVRQETFQAAQAAVVNFHTQLPITRLWGNGERSSSDGQRFLTAQKAGDSGTFNRRYGREPGVTFYTHVSDQYSPFFSKVIASTDRDALHILDGLLYHQSDLRIKEHTTDSHGYTDAVFALMPLLGFRFTPRIRDLKHLKLFVPDRRKKYQALNTVISGSYDKSLIARHWEDILRLVTSIKSGHVTASIILRKLSSFRRKNSLLAALNELGKLYRTHFMLDWWSDPNLRRVVQSNLNKGELVHDLKRAVFCHGRGEVRDQSLYSQERRAGGLNFMTHLISTWNAVYLQGAVDHLRSLGETVSDEVLAHISPLRFEHIVFSGDYVWRQDLLPPEGQLRTLVGVMEAVAAY